MNIAVFYSELPYPNCSHGGGLRIFEMIKYLSKSHEISLFCTRNLTNIEKSKIPLLRPYIKDIFASKLEPLKPNLLTLNIYLKRFLSPIPIYISNGRRMILEKKLYELIEKKKIDLVLIDNLRTSGFIIELKEKFPNVKIVIIDDETPFFFKKRDFSYNFKTYFNQIINGPNKFHSIINLFTFCFQIKKLKRYEKKIWRKSDLIYTLTWFEIQKMKEVLSEINVLWTTHGIKKSEITFVNEKHKDKLPKLVFLGSKHTPNIDAVIYFQKEIFPLIFKHYPSIEIHLIGKMCEILHSKNLPNNFKLYGFVEDLDEIYRNDYIYLLPIRLGGGFRSKIVKAMGHEIPVVSTIIGVEGFLKLVQNGKHLLIAKNNLEFANQVIKLCEDFALRKNIGINARKMVLKYFMWDDIFMNMQKDLVSLLNSDKMND